METKMEKEKMKKDEKQEEKRESETILPPPTWFKCVQRFWALAGPSSRDGTRHQIKRVCLLQVYPSQIRDEGSLVSSVVCELMLKKVVGAAGGGGGGVTVLALEPANRWCWRLVGQRLVNEDSSVDRPTAAQTSSSHSPVSSADSRVHLPASSTGLDMSLLPVVLVFVCLAGLSAVHGLVPRPADWKLLGQSYSVASQLHYGLNEAPKCRLLQDAVRRFDRRIHLVGSPVKPTDEGVEPVAPLKMVKMSMREVCDEAAGPIFPTPDTNEACELSKTG
ncbi:unnamed protein product [Protopolystoma xenopodis]|uniref:Uncharacterized protein n=1 Tax=Protopolystoma xenopodis TaxID=117903 RepID=A0A3S5B6F3_9PLAT|nr:unnamed protein product [Protopolystoma xenopodis]